MFVDAVVPPCKYHTDEGKPVNEAIVLVSTTPPLVVNRFNDVDPDGILLI